MLIYCVSQLMAALNEGRPTSPVLHLKAHDLLLATSREASGDGYRRLREALERLSGTRIVTNIATGGVESTRGFGLIDAWEILRKTRGGRMILVTVTLSDWMYRSVVSKSVLTLHRDYFHLRKPLERRVYEIARKHCGRQAEWRIGLEIAAEEIRLDLAAAGVPQDDPRHGRRGRAARLYAGLRHGDVLWCARATGSATGRGAGDPRLPPRRTPARARRRPATTPTGSRRNGCGSGAAAAARRSRSPEAAFLAFCRARAARAPRRERSARGTLPLPQVRPWVRTVRRA